MFDANYKQQELFAFLDVHFCPTENYTSKVFIAYDAPFCNRKFKIFYNYQTGKEESFDEFPHVFDGRNAYYITANSFREKNLRRLNNLYTLHNLVIDIDCHTYGIDKVDIQQELDICEEYLTEYFKRSLDFPCPNTIVKTGRGFQLWWAILPIPAQYFRSIYEQTVDYFCEKMGKVLRKCSCLSLVHVDNAASRKITGLFRLPGTFNRKTQSFGSFEILHEDRLDMVRYFYDNIVEPKDSGLPYVRRRKYSQSEYRTKILNRLVAMRRKEGIAEDGYRDLYCFIFFNIRASESTVNKAWKETLAFNAKFVHPLNEKRLRKYLSTSMKKIYHFSNKAIISYLNITETEQRSLRFFPARNREEQRLKKREEKLERNKKIIALAKKGLSQRHIAKEVGCSQSTVCRVVKKEEEKWKKAAMDYLFNQDRRTTDSQEDNKMEKESDNLMKKATNKKTVFVNTKVSDKDKIEHIKEDGRKEKSIESSSYSIPSQLLNKYLKGLIYYVLKDTNYIPKRNKKECVKRKKHYMKDPP